jgi:hypothetical protein
VAEFREFFAGWRPSPGLVYLITFLLFAGLIFHLQEMNDRDSCQARNELRAQFTSVQIFDDNLRNEVRDYLTLRLDGDKDKIAEGVPSLKQTIVDLGRLASPVLEMEDC